MIPTQTLVEFPVFGNAACIVKPGDAKYSAGFLPADVLPAEWHNYFLNKDTSAITCLNAGVSSMESELNCVVTSAGLTPAEETPGQVAQAISCCVVNDTSRTIQILDNAGANCGSAVGFRSSTALQIKLPATICATICGNAATATLATCAQKDGSGCSLGTAARYSYDTFMPKCGGTFTGPVTTCGDIKVCCAICFNTGVQPWKCAGRNVPIQWLIGIDCYQCGGRVYYSSIADVAVGCATNATNATNATSATNATLAAMATNAKGACTPFIVEANDYSGVPTRSYNEGIRINASTCAGGWTTLTIGTAAGTQSGITQGFWLGTNVCNHETKLFVNYHCSAQNSYFQGNTDGTTTWVGNVTGNVTGTASCATNAAAATNATYAAGACKPFIVEVSDYSGTNESSYNQGIRINDSGCGNGGWTTLTIGTPKGSTCAMESGFFIGTNNCNTSAYYSKLFVNYKNSGQTSYFQGNADGTTTWVGAVCGNVTGNVTGSAGSATTATYASCAKRPFIIETTELPSGWSYNYNEGIRINSSACGFSTLFIGGEKGSREGCTKGFWLGTNSYNSSYCGKLFVNYQNSGKSSYFQGNTDGTTTWVGDVTGTASCAKSASYATSAASASKASRICIGKVESTISLCSVYIASCCQTATCCGWACICNTSGSAILLFHAYGSAILRCQPSGTKCLYWYCGTGPTTFRYLQENN